MDNLAMILLAVALLAIAGVGAWWLSTRGKPRQHDLNVHASLEQLRAVGELQVYKVMTREIVTETDHSWGEWGAKYLSWMLSKKKMAMIFEFEIAFSYDLNNPALEIKAVSANHYLVHMPPCQHQAFIRSIQFYDEQAGKLLPWLLPDLLNGFLSAGFDENDKNRLVAAARGHAEVQAAALIKDLNSEVHRSAKHTLSALAKGFGAQHVSFEFEPSTVVDLNVGMAQAVQA
jgi:hypothetical protein